MVLTGVADLEYSPGQYSAFNLYLQEGSMGDEGFYSGFSPLVSTGCSTPYECHYGALDLTSDAQVKE